MADNLTLTSGSGVTVATDEVGSVHYQRIKLVDGNLESSGAVGVFTSPLFVNVSNTSATVSIMNTSSTVSVLNTLSVVSVLNTGGTVSVLNTGGTVSVLNTSATISVLNTSNTISVLNTSATISVLNTGGTVSILNTSSTISVLNTLSIISILNTSATISVLNTGGTVSILNTGGTISILNTGGTVSIMNTGGTISVLNTSKIVQLSAGTALVGAFKRDVINYTGTWIYAALSSNNQTAVWTPAANKRFNITDITVNALTAGLVTFTQDTAATITIMKVQLAANGGWVSNLQTPYIASDTNHALAITSTVALTNSYVCISGYESV